ncbi:hypothetical protein HYFRA_00009258 [Hymenoscyphus fraxineus]|uniref:Uncharacterized protein n=1 Tax=Hymenoscyphus fraxineus TaxID=746836 RepID=A0A9N9L4V6_9HELO|nr:hypothetical protein HYFRA_00009258 [Hymenoscyphus fraxineus]
MGREEWEGRERERRVELRAGPVAVAVEVEGEGGLETEGEREREDDDVGGGKGEDVGGKVKQKGKDASTEDVVVGCFSSVCPKLWGKMAVIGV